nr:S1C family serine protease [Hyphomicrobiales bacterium]
MTRFTSAPTHRLITIGANVISNKTVALFAALAFCLAYLPPLPAMAQTRGPSSVADIADPLKAAVVNIATTQKLQNAEDIQHPEIPQDSPFQEFFEDFFNQDEGGGGQRASSLGSGFVIDPSGLIVTNYHVI